MEEVIAFVCSELLIPDALVKGNQLEVEMLKSALVANSVAAVVNGLLAD
jgi:hypothetical protein